MKFTHFLFCLVLLIVSCSKKPASQNQESPQLQKNSAMNLPVFDGKKAYDYLTAQTNFGPRNPNSLAHTKCQEYLYQELKKYADVVTLQQFSVQGYNETLKLANIFASFNPTQSKRILLLAHWDSRPRAEMDPNPAKRSLPIIGANDGASGVAVLIEIARILKSTPSPIGVDILLTDGEDYGDSEKDRNTDLYFLGAKHFAKIKAPNYKPEFGILLDMVGDRDLQFSMEGNSMKFAPHIVDLVWSTAEEIGATQFVRIPGETISDDHLAINEAGIPTIDIIDFQYPYWHTHQDTPDKCSAESLEAVGKVLTAVIYSKVK